MKTDSMETPTTREEFELRFHLLKNVMANDRLKVSSSVVHGLNGIGQVSKRLTHIGTEVLVI